jgi:hypothetical protein
MRVYRDWQAPTGWRVHSLAADDWQTCDAYLRGRLGLPKWEPNNRRRESGAGIPARPSGKPSKSAMSSDNDYYRFAMQIWRETRPLVQTIAETYLVRRIDRALTWSLDLRFHPNCPGKFGAKENRKREFHPAMIALFRDIATNEPRAIHRTFLKPDGSDRLRDEWGAGDQGKQALARHVGCAVKLSPDHSVTTGLGIGEGTETCLSLIAEGWAPIWALCGTAGLGEFPVLAGVDSLAIFSDNDRNGAGRKAAGKAALRWCEASRDVQIITPRQTGADWDNALRSAA